MAKNRREIILGKHKYLVVDLTEPLKMNTEVYLGEPKPSMKVATRIQDSGFQYNVYTLGEHNFHPHCDAPSHQNPGLSHLGTEMFNLEFCFNPAILIDLSKDGEAKKIDGIKYLDKVSQGHLENFAKQISRKKALLIRTGYDKWLESNKPHQASRLPHLSPDAADFIAGFPNLRVFGIDSITIDPVNLRYAHRRLKNLMVVESLVHLYEIPKVARENFDLQTSAVRIVGSTGCPVAAYAFIPRQN